MTEGMRDAFIENDVVGNTNIGASGIFNRTNRLFKKKRKRSRTKVKRAHRIKRRRKHSKRTHARTMKRKGKRKGMSKEFLRNLRKKHHLGEFKK